MEKDNSKKAASKKKVEEEKKKKVKKKAMPVKTGGKVAKPKADSISKAETKEKTVEKAKTKKKATIIPKPPDEKAKIEKSVEKKAAVEKKVLKKAKVEPKAAEKIKNEKDKAVVKKVEEKKVAAQKEKKENGKVSEKKVSEKKAKIKNEVKVEIEKMDKPDKKEDKPETNDFGSYDPPPMTKEVDPTNKMIKMGAGALAFLFLLIIVASLSNSDKYNIISTKSGIEIWKGKFAPIGKELFVTLDDAALPVSAKSIYYKKEIYPLISNHYINKADALLNVPNIPDFDKIKAFLNNAMAYADTNEIHRSITARINGIDRNILLYKAEVAKSRGGITELEAALQYLKDALDLSTEKSQGTIIKEKINIVENTLKQLKTKQTEPKTAAKK